MRQVTCARGRAHLEGFTAHPSGTDPRAVSFHIFHHSWYSHACGHKYKYAFANASAPHTGTQRTAARRHAQRARDASQIQRQMQTRITIQTHNICICQGQCSRTQTASIAPSTPTDAITSNVPREPRNRSPRRSTRSSYMGRPCPSPELRVVSVCSLCISF